MMYLLVKLSIEIVRIHKLSLILVVLEKMADSEVPPGLGGEKVQKVTEEKVSEEKIPGAKKAAMKAVVKKAAKAKAKAAAKRLSKKTSSVKDDEVEDGETKDAVAKQAAKAKPKGAAKAKAKGSPAPKVKAKAKAAVRDLKKRLMDSANKAFNEDQAEDEEEIEEGKGEDDDQKRDRCKKFKFDTLMSQGKLPAHIVEQYQHGTVNNKHPRKFQTQFVNSLFERDQTSGKLVMTPNAPMFQAWKTTGTAQEFHDKQVGLPKRVFMGKYFNNSEQALNDAIANDEVQVMLYEGKEWYVFRSLEFDKIQTKSYEQKLLQSEKGLDKSGCKELVQAFDEVTFDFGKYITPKLSTSLSSSSSSSQLAIADVPKGVLCFDTPMCSHELSSALMSCYCALTFASKFDRACTHMLYCYTYVSICSHVLSCSLMCSYVLSCALICC
jgi:hypothetical protein